jgi:hypothetical protein
MLDFDQADDGYLAELAGLVAIPSVSRDAAPETMRAAHLPDYVTSHAAEHRALLLRAVSGDPRDRPD